jgi:hypothetical protein
MSYVAQNNYSPLNNYSYDNKPFVISTLDCFSAPLRWLLGARNVYPLSYTDPMSLDRKIATVAFISLTYYLAPSFATVLVGVFVCSLALKYVFSYITSEKDEAIRTINNALQWRLRQQQEASERDIRQQQEVRQREEAQRQQRLRAQEALEVQINQLKGEFDTLFNQSAWLEAVRSIENMPSQGLSSVYGNLYKCFENIISNGDYSMKDVRRLKSFQALQTNDRKTLMTQIQADKSNRFYDAFKSENWRLAIHMYAQIPSQEKGTLPRDFQTCVDNIIKSGTFTWGEITKYIKSLNLSDYTAIIDLVIRSKLDWERQNNHFLTNGDDLCGFVCNLLGDGNIKNVFECTKGILENVLPPDTTQDNILILWIKLNLAYEMIGSYKNRIESKHAGKNELILHKSDNLRFGFSTKFLSFDGIKLYPIFEDLEMMQKVSATINMLRSATVEERQQANVEAVEAMHISAMNNGFILEVRTLEKEKAEFSSLQKACLAYDAKLSELSLISTDEEKQHIVALQKFIIEVIESEKYNTREFFSKSKELKDSLNQIKQIQADDPMEFLRNSIRALRNCEFCMVIDSMYFPNRKMS